MHYLISCERDGGRGCVLRRGVHGERGVVAAAPQASLHNAEACVCVVGHRTNTLPRVDG